MLINAKMSAPKIAGPHPFMSKFASIPAASLNTIALTTKVNSPKVNIFTGKVRKRRSGLKTIFKKPTTKLANMALPKLFTSKPLTSLDVKKIASAESIQTKIKLIIKNHPSI